MTHKEHLMSKDSVNRRAIYMAASKVATAGIAWNEKAVLDRVRDSDKVSESDLVEFAELLGKLPHFEPEAGGDLYECFFDEGLPFVRKVIDNILENQGRERIVDVFGIDPGEHFAERVRGSLLANGMEAGTAEILARAMTQGKASTPPRTGAELSEMLEDLNLVEDPEITRRKTFSTQKKNGRPKGYAPWNLQGKTKVIMAQVKQILDEYQDSLPLTARQIFYRLVGLYGYPKTESAYESLTNFLVRARRSGVIDFEDIRDDGASVMRGTFYRDENAFYKHVHDQGKLYQRYKLARQKLDIRVYCESAGMMPQLKRVTDNYSIPVYSCSGFDSLTAKYELARDIMRAYTYQSCPTVILHLGDMDPSGETIFDAISEDVYAFLEVDVPHKKGEDVVVFERVALTPDLVAEYGLPTDPAKESSHSAGWDNRRACQLEALAPDVLADVLAEAIEDHLDLAVLELDREEEVKERRQITLALPAAEPKTEDESA
jgi:hypothetical protein